MQLLAVSFPLRTPCILTAPYHYSKYTQSHFQPTRSAVAAVQSDSLTHRKVCSVWAVPRVATTSALGTGAERVLLANIVVVPTGVGMPFSYLIAKAARSLCSRGQQYPVSHYIHQQLLCLEALTAWVCSQCFWSTVLFEKDKASTAMSTRHFPYFYPRIEPQPIWSTLIDFPAISSVTYVRSLETFIQQWLQNNAQRLDDESHHLWLVCFCIVMSLFNKAEYPASRSADVKWARTSKHSLWV